MSNTSAPDFLKIIDSYNELKPGPKSELRRVAHPDDLIEVPAFYRLLHGNKASPSMQRVIYCLPCIHHKANGMALGEALAKSNISEKRLFMVIRSESPNDLIQMRRLLKMTEPTVDWSRAAKTFYYWNEQAKRNLLEDYFYHQNTHITA